MIPGVYRFGGLKRGREEDMENCRLCPSAKLPHRRVRDCDQQQSLAFIMTRTDEDGFKEKGEVVDRKLFDALILTSV
jgi:hypothetical protein